MCMDKFHCLLIYCGLISSQKAETILKRARYQKIGVSSQAWAKEKRKFEWEKKNNTIHKRHFARNGLTLWNV